MAKKTKRFLTPSRVKAFAAYLIIGCLAGAVILTIFPGLLGESFGQSVACQQAAFYKKQERDRKLTDAQMIKWTQAKEKCENPKRRRRRRPWWR